MQVTKESLRTMIETFGGLNMSDEELEQIVPQIQQYVDLSKQFDDFDLSEVLSTRLIRADEGMSGP